MAVVKNLMVRAGADFSSMTKSISNAQKSIKSFGDNVNKTMNDMHSKISNSMKIIGTALAGLAIGKVIKDSVSSAMEIEAALQQIKRTMGESSNQFLKWADNTAIAFNMSKGDAIKYGAVFSNLVSGYTKSTAEATQYTQQLLQASSIIASSTGRTMEDVMERIRSGLLGNTESIEDLGVNVNVAMIQSTEAFKKFANGRSWQQLDFQTQNQIRLMAILEQTSKKYGDSVQQNTASSMQQFTANLKNLQMALGQAFLPILNVILPILSQFVSYLATAMGYVTQFMQTLFGKSSQQSQNSTNSLNNQTGAINTQIGAVNNLGDAYAEAGKKAEGSMAGFDEINTLSSPSSSSGGGTTGRGTGGGIPTGGNVDTSGLDSAKEKISGFSNYTRDILSKVFQPFKDAWDKYGSTVINNLKVVGSDIKDIMQKVGQTLYNIWSNPSIQQAIDGLCGTFSNLFGILTKIFDEIIKPALSDFLSLLDPSQTPAAQMFADVIGNVLQGIKDLTGYIAGDGFKYVKPFFELFLGFKAAGFLKEMYLLTASIIANTGATIANTAAKIIDKAETAYLIGLYAIEAVQKGINTAATWLQVAATTAWNVIASIGTAITTAFGIAMQVLMSPITLIILAIGALIAIIVLLVKHWDDVKNAAASVWEGIKNIWNGVANWFNKTVLMPLGNFFSNLWSGIKNGVIDAINFCIFAINGLLEGLLAPFNLIISGLNLIPGVDIPELKIAIPKIPKLAQGGYLGANNPRLIVAGDNMTEGEIVAPESKIYEQTLRAFKDAMGNNNTKQDSNLNLKLMVGNSTIANIMITALNEYVRQHGELPIKI